MQTYQRNCKKVSEDTPDIQNRQCWLGHLAVITAESGANDGLGYPFLFLALYLIKYAGMGGAGQAGGVGEAFRLWFGETW